MLLMVIISIIDLLPEAELKNIDEKEDERLLAKHEFNSVFIVLVPLDITIIMRLTSVTRVYMCSLTCLCKIEATNCHY